VLDSCFQGKGGLLEQPEDFEDNHDNDNHSNYVKDISAHVGNSYQIARAMINIYLNLVCRGTFRIISTRARGGTKKDCFRPAPVSKPTYPEGTVSDRSPRVRARVSRSRQGRLGTLSHRSPRARESCIKKDCFSKAFALTPDLPLTGRDTMLQGEDSFRQTFTRAREA
jgi:hypothetical protein